jgi:hypothetical protein
MECGGGVGGGGGSISSNFVSKHKAALVLWFPNGDVPTRRELETGRILHIIS